WIIKLCSLLAVTVFTGCIAEIPGSFSSAGIDGTGSEASKQTQSSEPDNIIPTRNADTLTAYFFQHWMPIPAGSDAPEEFMAAGLDRDISAGLTPALLEEILTHEDAPTQITIKDVVVSDDAAHVDLGSVNTGNQVYKNETFFMSCTLTLLNNCEISKVFYTLDGGRMLAYKTEEYDTEDERGVIPAEEISFSDEGEYQMPAYQLPSMTQDEISVLRQGVSYDEVLADEQARRIKNGNMPPLNMRFFPSDSKAEEITRAIQDVVALNMPQTNFDTIADAPNDFIVMAAMLNTPYVFFGPMSTNEEAYYSQFDPLADIISDMQCTLQEHVEITAKRLFGEDVQFTHSGKGISPWKYWEYAGVYTPPHMGTPYPDTILLDYTEDGDTVTATAVFFSEALSVYPKDKTLEEYYQNDLERHRFTLRRQGDGYLFTGHRVLDSTAE
ncbi:MAG: hypothetical protein ACERKO_09875, partial [Acetanaerobacterium sp.]